ncbi:uncharacterized protein [Rutidosis leptorrhynchoides]|uniref:uncharacterized protein isoform X1 n=1 Tax=Rutidosis leptorrhynchoides TaxID=125765 RepID=UPI003A9979D6
MTVNKLVFGTIQVHPIEMLHQVKQNLQQISVYKHRFCLIVLVLVASDVRTGKNIMLYVSSLVFSFCLLLLTLSNDIIHPFVGRILEVDLFEDVGHGNSEVRVSLFD